MNRHDQLTKLETSDIQDTKLGTPSGVSEPTSRALGHTVDTAMTQVTHEQKSEVPSVDFTDVIYRVYDKSPFYNPNRVNDLKDYLKTANFDFNRGWDEREAEVIENAMSSGDWASDKIQKSIKDAEETIEDLILEATNFPGRLAAQEYYGSGSSHSVDVFKAMEIKRFLDSIPEEKKQAVREVDAPWKKYITEAINAVLSAYEQLYDANPDFCAQLDPSEFNRDASSLYRYNTNLEQLPKMVEMSKNPNNDYSLLFATARYYGLPLPDHTSYEDKAHRLIEESTVAKSAIVKKYSSGVQAG